jgi:hypothetical protein
MYASSMVMLDSARRKAPLPALARRLLGLGIAATPAANVAHGLGHGMTGAQWLHDQPSRWWKPSDSFCGRTGYGSAERLQRGAAAHILPGITGGPGGAGIVSESSSSATASACSRVSSCPKPPG